MDKELRIYTVGLRREQGEWLEKVKSSSEEVNFSFFFTIQLLLFWELFFKTIFNDTSISCVFTDYFIMESL